MDHVLKGNGSKLNDDAVLFYGYIALKNKQGLKRIEIRKDQEYINVWIDDDLADDVQDVGYLIAEYGRNLYLSMDDYKQDKVIDVESVWPNLS